MARLSILHLSDLHFVGLKSPDQKIVLEALLKDFRSEFQAARIRPDLVVFSGDLVQAGASLELFAEARREFIEPMAAAFGISAKRIIICPGNHDISKSVVDAEDY